MTGPALVTGAVTLGGLAAHGAFYRNSLVFGRALGRLPTRDREVALTFDDGPNPEATPRILDALAAAGVRATFFILGRHAERWPALVRRVHDEGHAIGNHGYHHRKLHFRPPAYVRDDLSRGTEVIAEAAGARPALFRAPHGFRSPWVNGIAASLGQRVIGWSLGVWDSARPGVDEIVRRTVLGTRPGAILLLHDGDGYDPAGDRSQTAQAVPLVIQALRESGYRFVTVPPA
ncbi:MAG TPA: polysaccharide deacetylase family protein [Gemmatimonadaceae bacterium]|jgi:peptidoglycan/xylan/chitin deacetylase (PgdA/CDA1 family)|nr:polysaccharide deacetylase family protein [Gemmatimonadaceae bacterium]